MRTEHHRTPIADEPTAPFDRTLVDTRPVPMPPARPRRNWPTIAALVASVALGAAGVLAFTSGSPEDRAGGSPAAETATSTSAVPTTVAVPTTTASPVSEAPISVAPVPTTDAEDEPAATIPPVPTVPPDVTAPPTVAPPAGPAPVLSVPKSYELDPGVHDVTVTVANEGDAPLHFELANHGDGYTADYMAADIEPGETFDIFVELDVSPEGDGPTPFERAIEVASDGGDATVTISGQVEKPGFLVAEFESVSFVDYRATVRFTNVGGLPVTITDVDAPGLTSSPLPATVGGGETLEIEVAVCGQGVGLPVKFATPQLPLPLWTFASHVAVTTGAGTVSTTVAGTSLGFFPPSCLPVVVPPITDLVLGG